MRAKVATFGVASVQGPSSTGCNTELAVLFFRLLAISEKQQQCLLELTNRRDGVRMAARTGAAAAGLHPSGQPW